MANLAKYVEGNEITASQKVAGILDIYRELNIREITLLEIEQHHLKALEILHSVDLSPETTNELIGLMQVMLGRER